ncbi:DNA polymerase sliding clamp [Natronorubrum sp. FCH18a]|uniref:DNA polymerase sliding clamp n=1 Tax=Natronorubrum sp. FCH18a TaxID=3447018 RepID=UPI003F50E9AF
MSTESKADETQSVDEPEPEPQPEAEEKEEEADPTPDLTTESGGFACKATAGDLLAFFEQYTPILDEMKLHLESDGLEGRGVDPANVGMVDERLDAAAFDHYSSTGGLIGLDLSRITDILSLGESRDPVSLELDQETRKLEIVIDGLEYTLALIDPDSIRQEPDIPDLELPASVTLEGKDIHRAVKAADMVSDHMRFETRQNDAGEDAFVVSAEGDTDDVVLDLTREDVIDLEMGDGDALFSLDYLKDLSKEIPANAEVTLDLGNEMPVFIQFEHIEDDDEEGDDTFHGEVTQMLAPRISSD